MEAMDLVDSKLHYQYFNRIADVDRIEWDSIVPRATGLKHNVLRTFEQSGINNLVCHYMLFKRGGRSVGKANLYEVSMDFTSLDKNLDPNTRHIIKLWHPQFLNLSMVECGLFAMNGDGLVVKDFSLLPDVISQINQKLHSVAAEKNLDLLVFRDIPLEQYAHYEKLLVPLGYVPVAGFTNVVIDITWPSIDVYLESLNSKDRYKLRNSLKISQNFDIRIEITSDYKHLAAEMAFLWANVNASSEDYNREQLDETFFFEAGMNMHANSEVILFYYGERLVAFMWSLIGEEDYHMADWGVDYDFPRYREANFYRAASVLSLKRAIELGKKRMQLGMTNYTAKKLLGAKMQPLVYFIKHSKKPEFSRVVARMITDAIDQPKELNYYASDSWQAAPMSAEEYKVKIKNKLYEYDEKDAFCRVEANYDIDLLKVGGLYSFYPDADIVDIHLSRASFIDYGKNSTVIRAGINVGNYMGYGNGGAPFFAGCSGYSRMLQERIARLSHKEAVQLLPSGSLIHITALSSLLESDTLVLMDEQNGPGIWEAVATTGCALKIYPHLDLTQLEILLRENPHQKKIIITESVFPSLGDCADLEGIAKLKHQYGARVYVDESFGFGLYGALGEGLSVARGVINDIDILVASTLAGLGIDSGFIAGPTRVIDYIRHNGRPLLFSSQLSNSTLSMLISALDQLELDAPERMDLIKKSEYLASYIAQNGFQIIHHKFPIINVIIGDFMLALAIQKKLANDGIVVAVAGPSISPPEIATLRLTLNHEITYQQLDQVIGHFEEIGAIIYRH